MPKIRSRYVCSECGHESAKWMGKCPGCGSWNTLVEELPARSVNSGGWLTERGRPVSINSLVGSVTERIDTGIGELDRVLGGGLVPGSLVLIGGDPGVGKSTLLLQVALSAGEGPILYVSGEESPQQIRSRAVRLGTLNDGLLIYPETNLLQILETAKQISPKIVIVDSIQTMMNQDITSAPGTVSQVRQCAGDLLSFAKTSGIPVVIVGHMTKGGLIAGPKVLEHAVDTVLYFEGDTHTNYRVIRAVKNRFGSSNEIGVFEMREDGLREVVNPSEVFIAERPSDEPGSVVVPCMEGSRPLLLEVQSLVTRVPFGGIPRRQTVGVDRNRANMVLAVLEKRASFALSTMDVYLNVAGGMKVEETAADLGMAVAIASSCRNTPASGKLAVFGELGLAGEVRGVNGASKRVHEAARMGFRTVVLPKSNWRDLTPVEGVTCYGVGTLREALSLCLEEVRE